MMLLPEMLFIPMLTSMHLVPISWRVYQFKAAWGFSHLYDQVKHVEMQTIKYRVMDVLGNRTTYYRVHRGEKHLTPEMQEQVKKVFAEYGYGEPAYDHYAEEIGFVYE